MEMAKFKNRFLTPIQGFTQSKIEKAILLNRESYTCFQLGLPEVECIQFAEEKILGNKKIIAKENFSKLYDKLTANQKNIFSKLSNFPSDKLYSIDEPRGSGKTFLYKTW